MENIAQTVALGIGYAALAENQPVAIGYIGAVKDLEIFSLPEVNDELITETIIEDKILNATVVSGKVWNCTAGTQNIVSLLVQCELKIFMKEA